MTASSGRRLVSSWSWWFRWNSAMKSRCRNCDVSTVDDVGNKSVVTIRGVGACEKKERERENGRQQKGSKH